jgi:Flp pilus assembly protein TadG
MAEREERADKLDFINKKRAEQGQDLVEFALILPLLLLLLLGIIEFGIAIFRYNSVANVGREIARYGVVHPKTDDLDAFIYTDGSKTAYTEGIRRWTRGLDHDVGTLDIVYVLNNPDSFLDSTVQVTVTYEHEFLSGPVILALGNNSTVDLRTVSIMNTE